MTITSRLSAGIAAFALVLAGITAVTPSTARAAPTGEALIAVAIFTAAAAAAFVLIDEEGDEDPQSP